MADLSRPKTELEQEAEGFTGGPGVVASKSQAHGSLGGIGVGAIAGGLLGLVVGLIFFSGALGVIIATVVFAVGGATFGGVAGGFVAPRRKLEGSEADR
ncbi:MAG TPA: hypothetical protein VJ927_08440 [Actinomycetota bacterium]|nr:hypothetical protein [Actinomycetota bacterium]